MLIYLSVLASALCLSLLIYMVLSPALRDSKVPLQVPLHWFWRLLWPWISLLAPCLQPFLTWSYQLKLHRELQSTGQLHTLSPAQLVAMQVSAALLTLAVATYVFVSVFSFSLSVALGLSLALAVLTAWLPRYQLRKLCSQRRRAIQKQLPFLLDMLTLCVESGLNLQAALLQTSSLLPAGALKQEIQYALNDMRTGINRSVALKHLAQRTGLNEMQQFAQAVAQSDRLGVGLGVSLRAQSEQRRNERFLRAEKLALEAPVKMLMPLVTCIFPCTFLVLMFPIAMKLMQADL